MSSKRQRGRYANGTRTLLHISYAKFSSLAAAMHRRFLDVPEGPVIVVAQELFDALPVHQFMYTERGWCERLVDIDDGECTSCFAPINSLACELQAQGRITCDLSFRLALPLQLHSTCNFKKLWSQPLVMGKSSQKTGRK